MGIKDKIEKGWEFAREAGVRLLERGNGTTRKSAPALPPDVKPLFREAARIAGLPIYTIYELVNIGLLSPYLSEARDWHLLEEVLPRIARSEVMTKASLSRMSRAKRQELVEHPLETKVDRFIRRKIEENPSISRDELMRLLEKRFPNIEWWGKHETGVEMTKFYAARIRKIRDQFNAKQRYRARTKHLSNDEIQYFKALLLYHITRIRSLFSCPGFVQLRSENGIEHLQAAIRQVEAAVARNTTTTLRGALRLCDKLEQSPPCAPEACLELLIEQLQELAQKSTGDRWDQARRYLIAIREMSWTERLNVRHWVEAAFLQPISPPAVIDPSDDF